MTKQRIKFIDLAKGICILLVVLVHVAPDFYINCNFVCCIRMPLFFCLSGLFFKDYGCFKNFVIMKSNKILIPFVAWYIISYVIYFFGHSIINSQAEAHLGILDIFHQNEIHNLPIWFLLCLFWVNIIFGFIQYFSKGKGTYVCIGVCIATFLGWIMSTYHIFNFLYIGSSLTCLPFFYMGYLLKRTPILYPTENNLKDFCIMAGAFIGATLFVVLCSNTPMIRYYRNEIVYGNPFQIYCCAALFVIGVLMLCKLINYIPYISWLGRYSIIVLITHIELYAISAELLKKIQVMPPLLFQCVNFVIVISSMSIVIPFCKKYLPYITAQKNLIPIKRIP